MDEDTKKFFIKFGGIAVIVAVLVIGIYYAMSPYQNCIRADDGVLTERDIMYCINVTSW